MAQTERLYRHNVPAARRLRREQTPSEDLLWERLRGHRFQGLKWRRQHPVGRFVLDFYCHELGVAIEIDGLHHGLPAQRLLDAERELLIRRHGIRFVRVGALDVVTDIESVMKRLATEVWAR